MWFSIILVRPSPAALYGDEKADAGRDCHPSREAKLSDANEDKEIFIFPVQLTMSRLGNLIRLNHTLAICVTRHPPVQQWY